MNQIAAFTSYGRGAGSARVRIYDWFDHLNVAGTISSYLNLSSSNARTLVRHPLGIVAAEARLRTRIDSVATTALISRQATPFSNGGVEHRILTRAALGVYDFDDALMHTPDSRLERIWSKRRIWKRSVQSADVVIAGNEYLAQAAQEHNTNVVIIPSCVAPSAYLLKDNYEQAEAPVAVWLGSPKTEQYLSLVEEPLLRLHRARGLRLTVVSAGAASLGALNQMVDRVQWSEQGYQEHLTRSDFGIMPVDDTAWSRGKCSYKLLQYGAAGLPMIGSNVGMNAAVLAAADGLAPLNIDEWYEAMETLIDESATRRAERGKTARAAIVEHYSFAAWASVWREVVGLS